MKSTRLSWLDPQALARLTGGNWVNAPSADWHPQKICFHYDWAPHSLVIPKGQPFRHGLDLDDIDPAELENCAMLVAERMVDPSGIPQLIVPSIDDAVESLAATARSRFTGTICAVTGSVGKSSTSHLIAHVLRRYGQCSPLRPGVNTKAGAIAQTINLHDEDFAIIEMSVGKGLQATEVVRPHLAILTAIAPAHMTYAGPLPRLAQLKARIFTGLESNGTAILNRNVPYFEKVQAVAKRHAGTTITYGEHDEADFRLLDYDRSQQLIHAEAYGHRLTYKLGVDGRHMAINSLAVLSTLSALGLDYKEGASLLAGARGLIQRGRSYSLRISRRKVTLIDDSHNANPASMVAAFHLLAGYQGRRILVLGDMLELGQDEVAYHRDLVDPILDCKIDKVHVMGTLMAHLWDTLPGHIKGAKCDSAEGLREAVLADLEDGDVVLFKGSHANMLWNLVKDLIKLNETETKDNDTVRPRPFSRNVLRRVRRFSNVLQRAARGLGSRT